MPETLGNINTSAMIIAAVTFVVAIFWPTRLNRRLPAPLVALIAGTLLGILWLNDAPVIGQIPTGLPSLQIGLLPLAFLIKAIEPALILALLGSIDSLLTSLVADSLTGTQHKPNKELVGQGIGNIVAGLFGALPGAGATMGTVVNIRAGGLTQVSGALRAILLLGLVLGLGRFVEPIPLAALAAILMKVGWDIIDWRMVVRMHRIRREHLFVILLTLGLTVFVDLVTAVAIGLIAAGMSHALQLERLELDSVTSVPLLDSTFLSDFEEVDEADMFSARVGLVALKGRFTVASANRLVVVISADIKDHEVVIFDFSETTSLDDSAAMLILQLINSAAKEQTECIVMGARGPVARTLDSLNILDNVPKDRLVETLDEARQVSANILYQTMRD